ncbi:MAG: shikimate kinase [Clostridiales bacterium]|nr:shikimate kinase [Clostridiales bacterium]
MNDKNIILIGMPGSGKSTVGVVLAKALGYRFIDSDLLIQETLGDRLSEIIEKEGIPEFHRLENIINLRINPENTVIATGGSAIYGEEAMNHFRQIGTVIYLKLSYEEIEKRLGDLKMRGITIKEGETLKDLYEERIPLYEKYAHVVLDTEGLMLRETVSEIISLKEAQ